MSVNASTKQILCMFCQSVCPANSPALGSRQLNWQQNQWDWRSFLHWAEYA